MAYKVIQSDSAEGLTTLVNADGQSAIGGVAVVPADSMNRVRFFQAVGPAPGGGAEVNDGDTVAVVNSAGADSHNATATVNTGSLTNVKLAATVAMVDQGDSVTMQNSAGTAIAGTHSATVTAGALANVKLAATVAPVTNSQSVTIQNSAGTAVAGTHAATVAAGVVSNIKLAATVAPVVNGAALTVPVTGTYTTTATISVANGVVTGIVLS